MTRPLSTLFSFVAKPMLLATSGIVLASASPPPQTPGEGVLCLGTFIYLVERVGLRCRAGEDPEFQERIAGFTHRFDDYIIRNTGGDPATLAEFKEGQGVDSDNRDYICSGDVAHSYDHFKAVNPEELESAVDQLLAQDGLPTFGDCV